jgi:peptidyl-prolyl cis-trans isomerase C
MPFSSLTALRLTLPALALGVGMGVAQAQAPADDADNAEVEVLADINGETITARELDQLVSQQTQGQSEIPPPQRRQFLEEIINLMLLAQAGDAAGIDEAPDVAAQLNNDRRRTLAQGYVRQITETEPVSESVLRERYDEVYGADAPREYKARHILVSDREQAAALVDRLDSGESFVELAGQYSEDGTSRDGGNLGWFAPGDMVEPFSAAVADLEPGEVTDEPVETRFGFHVIRLDDTRETEAPAFSDVASELRMGIVNERIQAELEGLREDAEIDYEAAWARPDNG